MLRRRALQSWPAMKAGRATDESGTESSEASTQAHHEISCALHGHLVLGWNAFAEQARAADKAEVPTQTERP